MPRFRDLILVLVALLGIIVSLHLIFSHSSRTRAREAREEVIRQQALQEERLQEAERQAQKEKKRLEAERERALWEAQHRKNQEEEERRQELREEQRRQAVLREKQLQEERERRREAEEQRQAEETERKKREEQERLMLAKLTELRQLGIRSVPLHTASTDPFQNLGVWLKVISDPEGADVYLDWAYKGKTPLWLSGAEIAGFLLIVQEDHEAWFRDIARHENGNLSAHLNANTPRPRTRLLMTLLEDAPQNAFSFLRSRLSDSGFFIADRGAAEEFQRTEHAAGGLTNHAFRAWARAKFSTDLVLRARVNERNRGINARSPALTGTIRVFVDLDFDLYDLTTGEQLALITAAKSAFALDYARGLKEALEAATEDALPKLRRELER